ncbi:MAG: site-2 protease family protein [Actinomycetota bacterium]|nr:site-2 protease family protein [Actinomycetota bacterium]
MTQKLLEIKGKNILILVGVALVAAIAVSKGILTVYTGINILAALTALVFHEVSHGVVALYYGDATAHRAGRLSLSPRAHIDPFGTVILPLMLLLLGFPPFGYAKPVPINLSGARHRKRAELMVALAGPFTNLVLAVASGFALKVLLFSNKYQGYASLTSSGFTATALIAYFLLFFGVVNVIYFVLNMIPLPPLDGSAILRRVVGPERYQVIAAKMKYGIPILLFVVFLFPGVFGIIFSPFEHLWLSIFVPNGIVL